METVTPFDWQRIFIGDQPLWYAFEIVFRVGLIYLFAAVFLRFLGKRGRRELSPFEYMVIIALGSSVGDSTIYPDVPIFYACVTVASIILFSVLLEKLQLNSSRLQTFLEGEPVILIRDGVIDERTLYREGLRKGEFLGMLREEGIGHTSEVKLCVLEITGMLGILRYEDLPDEEKPSPSSAGESTWECLLVKSKGI